LYKHTCPYVSSFWLAVLFKLLPMCLVNRSIIVPRILSLSFYTNSSHDSSATLSHPQITVTYFIKCIYFQMASLLFV
jgi:hypothetical protein